MVSIIPTSYYQPYKGLWFSPEEDHLMDHGKQSRPSLKRSASLTDQTPLQSVLPASFDSPTRPIQPKHPETIKVSRKRKISEVESLTMSNPIRPRYESPPTINPQSLTATTSAPGELNPSPEYSSAPGPSYSTFPPPSMRRGSESTDFYYQNWTYNSPPVTRNTSITSVETVPMVSPQTMYGSVQHGYMQPGMYQPPQAYPPNYPTYDYPPQAPQRVIPSTPPHPVTQPGMTGVATPSHRFYGPPTPIQQVPAGSDLPPPPPPPPPQPSQQKEKPKCYDHGCNGREFSTFSNFLRHQRERDGTAPPAYCPHCDAKFTRTTARTNHVMNSKCKRRRDS